VTETPIGDPDTLRTALAIPGGVVATVRVAAAAVEEVLHAPEYRLAARALQIEAESLPPAEFGAEAVEQLVS
jgi:hypothetical protein